jgi:uncharacterized protein (TIGR03085 family)
MFMGMAADERRALSDLFGELGPDVPTLCEGWQSKDLAAHLALRDRRPDAAAGIQVKALSGYTERVQRGYADKPWAELVELVRTGPPALSPFRLPGLSELVNGTEFFVHHEDLRRGSLPRAPRDLDPEFEALLWQRLRSSAKLMFRQCPVGVTLVHTSQDKSAPRETVVAKHATPQMVTVAGSAGELVLFAFGRGEAAEVELSGDDSSVSRLRGAKLGI